MLVADIDYDYSSKLEKERQREALEMQDIMRDPKKRRQWMGVEGGSPTKGMNRFARTQGKTKRRW